MYKKLLKEEAIPTAATGFVPKRSIVDNASPHVKSKIIINIDLKDFFQSIKERKIYKYWSGSGWNEETSVVLTNICCKDGCLPQGASTSPSLSNVVNKIFDGFITTIAKKFGARYTRYADDMTISFSDKIKRADMNLKFLVQDLKELFINEEYKIQYDKGIKILRPHQRQIVTGLVVNEDVRIPREKRRLIRAMRHKLELGILSEKERKKIRGI